MDSDVTIALLKGDAIDVLGCLKDFRFMITETNYAEITNEVEKIALDKALAQGHLVVENLVDLGALTTFVTLLDRMDHGEAAVIALARHIGGEVAMHDRAGRRAAIALLSSARVHRLEDIMVEAVRAGCLAPKDVDQITDRLVAASDYRLDFASTGVAPAVADMRIGVNRTQAKD